LPLGPPVVCLTTGATMADDTKQKDEIGTTPDTARAFAAKANDLEALRAAVVDAASVGAALWFSYIFVLLYLFIAAGSVTHRDLLFENPVKLPFLNVDLPLTGFFWLGPALFLAVHAYVLLHLVLLADKVGAFHAELQVQIHDDDAKVRLRRQLPSNIFVQFLAGPEQLRTGVIGFMLRLIAQLSLIVGPLALLVFFQFQFLPYHDEAIAWWQRFAVIADLALLWVLWPSVARGKTTSRLGWRDLRRGKLAASAVASFTLFLMIFTVATFPGEWLDENLPSVRIIPTQWPPWKSQVAQPALLAGMLLENPKMTRYALVEQIGIAKVLRMRAGWTSVHELLFAGGVDVVAGKRKSLWSNTLELPNIDVIDHAKFDTEAKIAALPQTLSLRGRRLEGAGLVLAGLRKVDFTAAHLRGAFLLGADLREAKFGCDITGPQSRCTDLREAWLNWTQMEGVSLDRTQLQGASLREARLQGASLRRAQLQGAVLDSVQLQGASLDGADLRGAWLDNAWLQGASFEGARLVGASFNFAQLQGAVLDRAQLQGVSAIQTQLHGASLNNAQLQGAYFVEAQIQGAMLFGARLDGAFLFRIFGWRADVRNAEGEGAFVFEPETRPKYHMLGCAFDQWGPCDWSSSSFAALKRLIEQQVPEGVRRDKALNQIAILNPATVLDEREQEKAWADHVRSSPSLDRYENGLAVRLREIGCDANGAPSVLLGLLTRNPRFPEGSPQSTALATSFLDEAHCPPARALSRLDRVMLEELRDRSPPAPAPATPKE
jgi:uncharacterized protein YjbI with pentapeptide repeats